MSFDGTEYTGEFFDGEITGFALSVGSDRYCEFNMTVGELAGVRHCYLLDDQIHTLSKNYRGERTEVMYDGGSPRDRSDYYQALNAMSFPSDATSSEAESRLLMVVSGQHLGGEYASSKAYEVTSEQMTSNVIGGILAAAAGVSSTYEYTSTSSRLYTTFLFINSEGSVEYANVAGAPLCSDPTRSAQLLLGSAFVFGSEALTENRFC